MAYNNAVGEFTYSDAIRALDRAVKRGAQFLSASGLAAEIRVLKAEDERAEIRQARIEGQLAYCDRCGKPYTTGECEFCEPIEHVSTEDARRDALAKAREAVKRAKHGGGERRAG